MNKKPQTEIHLIVGLIFILGGLLYIINQSTFGGVLIALGIFIELLFKWLIVALK